MSEEKQYFKVVSVEDNGVLTSVVTRLANKLRVVYVPGHWAEAPVGGLLIFTDFAPAMEFKSQVYPRQVWLCEAEEEVTLPDRGMQSLILHGCVTESQLAQVRQHWDMPHRKISLKTPDWRTISWPASTRAFRRVRLLENLL